MRVIDFGTVPALRSQTLWHALARAARPGDRPILAFCRPRTPYVCLGYHRDIAEIDTQHCASEGLPVYRRMVGGGPVYLDRDQVFFQLVVPARELPARRSMALSRLLAPAVAALRDVGVDALLDRFGEISVGAAKVCGHGAGQLGEGAVVVGNLIIGFDHPRAARVLRLDDQVRDEVLRLMRRHLHPTPVEVTAWQEAMVERYSAHFSDAAVRDEMSAPERGRLRRMDCLLADPEFIVGQPRPRKAVRTVKVRAGVWVHDWSDRADRLVIGVADGAVTSVVGRCAGLGDVDLVGQSIDEARAELERNRTTAALAAAIRAANMEVMAA